ncbi:MAG: hypothetical protein J3K34DRAFT_417294 [Monoraphidium minutum]|nr:MAG: hypothetical protein J3K34DRAFT_417294 [Monoraphidium minutum]
MGRVECCRLANAWAPAAGGRPHTRLHASAASAPACADVGRGSHLSNTIERLKGPRGDSSKHSAWCQRPTVHRKTGAGLCRCFWEGPGVGLATCRLDLQAALRRPATPSGRSLECLVIRSLLARGPAPGLRAKPSPGVCNRANWRHSARGSAARAPDAAPLRRIRCIHGSSVRVARERRGRRPSPTGQVAAKRKHLIVGGFKGAAAG